ncbi:hypothetical protein Dvina_51405 [Dactylosporangium vinaceum]|uniref:Aminoglycoside phosphotransferase family protein n=1 Tax=Dactylosporangium vinaceum TaxID=53362 RepID=A0ABV5M2E7_9ACTN|nr:aminoglycoside phosphotransferase family protein [Dactylosporangium vinaceum]UAB96255.1 hypothetical protein Dvina_51405 [Dactylosporangium vinaceum]
MTSSTDPDRLADPAVEDDWTELRHRADRAGVRLTARLHHTDKAIVAAGIRDGAPVVAKLCTTDDAYWVARRDQELAVYRRFDTDPPPVPAPRLLGYDDRLTVLTQLPGERLHDHRHLNTDLPSAAVDRLLDTLDRVAAWQPQLPLPDPVDYPARLADEHDTGLLDDTEHTALAQMLTRSGGHLVGAHGDPLPANVLLDRGTVSLVDWEHAGRYLPGWDLAVLYTVGAHAAPTLAHAITDRAAATGIDAAFAVNAALLYCREVRMHRALPHGAVRTDRLAALHLHHDRVRALLRVT